MGPETQPAHDSPGDGNRGRAVTTHAADSDSEPWYAARCVFRWKSVTPEASGHQIYEERIVLIRAENFEDARHRAEGEARQYAADTDAEFFDFVEVFHLFDRKIIDGTEIFSLIRESQLPPADYVERFFKTGKEYRGES